MLLDHSHVLLIIFWAGYYALHSILALTGIKERIRQSYPRFFPYYRISYSTFFLLLLVGILIYQVRIPSTILFQNAWIRFGLGIPFCLAGLWIMAICIRKYFFNLSGVAVFYASPRDTEKGLEVNGLHRYVRHPLYAGTLLFAISLFLFCPGWNFAIMVILMAAYILVGIQLEEKKLLEEFGEAYRDYRSRTPKLLPTFRRRH